MSDALSSSASDPDPELDSEDDPDVDAGSVDASPSDSGRPVLTFAEGRVLGCLLEKEATTPDHYPLTFNSLHSACNQSSNRDPVTDLGTDEVEEAMEGLRYKGLAILVHEAGARVPKCKHRLEERFPYLTEGQRAVLCVLLLRGRQTAGELRQRTERMHSFADVDRVQAVLEELANYEPAPLVKRIPAGGGRRAVTYAHLLCGDVEDAPAAPPASTPSDEGSVPAVSWREEVEEEVALLRSEVETLRDELDELKSQLGG